MPMTAKEQADFDKMKKSLEESNLKNDELTKSGEKQLEEANKASTDKLNAANSKANLFDKYDLKEVDEALKLKREAKVNELKASGEYDKALAAEKEASGKLVAAEKERADGIAKQLEENIVGRALDDAINKAGGKVKPLRAVIGAEHTVKSAVINGEQSLQVFVRGSDTPLTKDKSVELLTLDDLVSTYKESTDTASLFDPSGKSGGGARTSVKTTNTSGSTVRPTESYTDFKANYGNFTEYFKPELLNR